MSKTVSNATIMATVKFAKTFMTLKMVSAIEGTNAVSNIVSDVVQTAGVLDAKMITE